MASMTVPMYLAECSPVHLRGRLTVADIMAVTSGQFVAAVIDYGFSYSPQGWRCVFSLCSSILENTVWPLTAEQWRITAAVV